MTHATLVGIAVGMVLTGLALPFAVGDRPSEVATEASGDRGAFDAAEPDDGPVVADAPATSSAIVSDGGALTADQPAAVGGPATTVTTAAAGTARAARTARTASDVGVTPDEIRLGFVLINVGPANELGTVVGIEVEQQRAAVKVLVDRINARGGIHGRRIRPVFAVWDVLDPNSGRTACLSLTEDGKVFAVIGSVPPPDVPCYAREHQTLLLWNCQACPDSSFVQGRERIVSASMRGSVHMAAWVAELTRVRYLTARKVGIVTDETNDPRAEMAGQLAAELRRSGREVVRVSRLSGDLQTGSSQIPVEVSQMRGAGAEVVFFVANRLFATQFVQQADSQRWDPLWSTSEAGSLNVDTCCENMPESFDGTLSINTAFDEDQPEPQASKACREAHDAKAPERLDERGSNEYSLTMGWCDYLTIFERGATGAGVELTRVGFHAAVEGIGALGPLAGTLGGRFGPGKIDLEDHARLQVWRASCRCWKGAAPFRPVR